MAYDENLADRIRQILAGTPSLTERKMFGGICFMLRGRMLCGVLQNDLVVKIGRENHNQAIARKHVRSFNFTGKPMVGIVYVAPAGLKTKKELAHWVAVGLAQAQSLPPKKKKR